MTRKVVFDFGAVVFHWDPAALLMRELPHIAPDADRAKHWTELIFEGYRGDWGDFDRGVVEVADLVLRIAARTGLTAGDVQTVIDAVPRELQPQVATVELMRRLKAAGHELFYLSNMPAPIAAELEARDDFLRWFKDGVFSSRVRISKPEPGIYTLAAKRFGARPDELVFIDDHQPNIAAARALGWDGFVFTGGQQAATELALRGLI